MRLRPALLHLALLWLAAGALRVTILSVPPLVPAIHQSLHLNEKLVGALSALPVLLLAAASVWGSLLVSRVGARRALVFGLCVIAVAGALRGFGTSTAVLFAMTLVMGAGIAISQPTLPSLARHWFPSRSSLATAAYSNGILIGEIVAAALTVPLFLPLAGGRWQLALAWWSVPVLLTATCVLLFTAHERPGDDAPLMRWWPDWRSARTWRLGLILGCASAAYFGANAFIPDYLRATHHAEFIAAALTSVNLSQLPASLVAAAVPNLVVARRWPVVVVGLLTVTSAIGFSMGGAWVVAWAGVLGFSTATVFVLSLALPPLLVEAHDVHRLSAAMFTIAYVCPFIASLLGGTLWDATGVPVSTFLPIAIAGALMIVLVVGLDLSLARLRSGAMPADQDVENAVSGIG